MKINLKLSKNNQIVPFNYQNKLVGTLHKWLGQNELHDAMSLYSFSWLTHGKATDKGLNFSMGSHWTIGSHSSEVLKTIVQNIRKDNDVAFGMKVQEVVIQEDPYFENEKTFMVGSPVFIKQSIDKTQKFYFYNDAESSDILTKTLKNKLEKAGLDNDNVSVQFDTTYHSPKLKAITYKGVVNKGSICPITIKGSPEQIAFAWNVGVGNSTGIGFGSLI
jgi:CRISPR-associated endoribonuclease Cas6